MERCPLLSLSLELFLVICDEVGCKCHLIFPNIKLDTTHLKRLRLTCKALAYVGCSGSAQIDHISKVYFAEGDGAQSSVFD